MTSDPGGRPRTVEELNAAVAAMGRDWPLQRWEQHDLYTDEGESALRKRPDGSVEVVVFGRGTDRVTTYPTEEAAVAALAEERLRPWRVGPALSEEEKASAEERLRRIKAEFAARGEADSGVAQEGRDE